MDVRYELLLNTKHSPGAKYVTLVHELAHLYCGHLGTSNDDWWPNRRGLSETVREFEAESVAFLVCCRLGIENPSHEYLSGYVKDHAYTPAISLDCVLKSAGLIEQMGQKRLKLRKEKGRPMRKTEGVTPLLPMFGHQSHLPIREQSGCLENYHHQVRKQADGP